MTKMNTNRKDVKRDNKQTICKNASRLGYSSIILKIGDLFTYTERYDDGTSAPRLAKCHGRIKPIGDDKWLILAQSANHVMSFTFERWVDPEDVIETVSSEYVDKNIDMFFEEHLNQ